MEIPANLKFAIIDGGNIGQTIAKEIVASGRFSPEQLIITKRKIHLLEEFAQQGYITQVDNRDAVRCADIIIIAAFPQQLNNLLHEINPGFIPEKHIVISVVSEVNTNEIIRHVGKDIPTVWVMPTVAIMTQESMTCITSKQMTKEAIELTKLIFDLIGETPVINEEQMIPATALCGCVITFFLRAIRAASQDGIEIGFHPYKAPSMAAQTAKCVAALSFSMKNHPEMEIDKVTTPEGCTIAGLNEMEHQGFSSGMIEVIITSAEKAVKPYNSRSVEKK